MTGHEPTTLWRLRHPSGSVAHATLIPGGAVNTLAWFVDGTMQGGENFETLDLALFKSEHVRLVLIDDGWIDTAE
jgi:hypothetical protein